MIRARVRRCAALILPVALLSLSACDRSEPEISSADAHGPVVAAVARGDGFIVPFAVYEDGIWRGPDAEPRPDLADRPAPWFAGRLDALGRWKFVTPLGLADLRDDPLPVTADGPPVEVGSHCTRVWALPTDLAGTPTPEHTVARLVGAAFSGSSVTGQVAELDVTLDEMGKFVTFLTPYFNAEEAREVGRRTASGGYEPRRVGVDVEKTPLAVSSLYRVGGSDGMTYYAFEASRTYPASTNPLPGCDEATVMTGWISESEYGAFALLASDLSLTNCHRKGSPIVQPMAAIRLDANLFAIVVLRHYEGESYAIVRVNAAAATTVLSVYGGGC